MTLSLKKDCPILTMFFKHLGESIQITGQCKLGGLVKEQGYSLWNLIVLIKFVGL